MYNNAVLLASQAKPLVLLSLLREMVGRKTELSVVFTSSVDSTHRLFRLLQLFGGTTHEPNTVYYNQDNTHPWDEFSSCFS